MRMRVFSLCFWNRPTANRLGGALLAASLGVAGHATAESAPADMSIPESDMFIEDDGGVPDDFGTVHWDWDASVRDLGLPVDEQLAIAACDGLASGAECSFENDTATGRYSGTCSGGRCSATTYEAYVDGGTDAGGAENDAGATADAGATVDAGPGTSGGGGGCSAAGSAPNATLALLAMAAMFVVRRSRQRR